MGAAAPTMTAPPHAVAPELATDAALDAALDLGLRRLVYGTLGGLVAGALLFRAWRWRRVEGGGAECASAVRGARSPSRPLPHS